MNRAARALLLAALVSAPAAALLQVYLAAALLAHIAGAPPSDALQRPRCVNVTVKASEINGSLALTVTGNASCRYDGVTIEPGSPAVITRPARIPITVTCRYGDGTRTITLDSVPGAAAARICRKCYRIREETVTIRVSGHIVKVDLSPPAEWGHVRIAPRVVVNNVSIVSSGYVFVPGAASVTVDLLGKKRTIVLKGNGSAVVKAYVALPCSDPGSDIMTYIMVGFLLPAVSVSLAVALAVAAVRLAGVEDVGMINWGRLWSLLYIALALLSPVTYSAAVYIVVHTFPHKLVIYT